ncbi:hypothetical protein VTK26DRAFT_4718 [Humicola hyalothermophila]
MSSKRHSILPPVSQAGPKPPVHFSSSITIADSALLSGTHQISVHSESVIHPRARLDSHLGRVSVGRRCLVYERAHLGAAPAGPSGAANPGPGIGAASGDGGDTGGGGVAVVAVRLEDYVVVEVGATVEGGETVLGEGTTVGVGARVGAGAVIGKYCTLTPHTEIAAGDVIPDFTVVYSNGMRRTDRRGVAEPRNKGIARQIDILRRMIPSNPHKFV